MELNEIKGIGTKTITLLEKLSIVNLDDLVGYYPYRYNVWQIKNLKDCLNDNGLIIGIVNDYPKLNYFKRNYNRLSFRVMVENKLVNVTIFNRGFMKNNIVPGNKISLYGKYDEVRNNFVASDIKLEVIENGFIEPVYHLVNGLSNKQVNKIIINTLDNKIDVNDYIPCNYVNRYDFKSKIEALRVIHQPSNINSLKQARIRLIYEEFFKFLFKINYLKLKREKKDIGIERKVNYLEIEEFIKKLPFKLTNDQVTTVNEIYQDMISKKRMNRIIIGDVGSGKTIVSIIAMIINCKSGYQSVLMAPTEVLALQHYKNIKELVKEYKVGLLIGSMKSKERKEILEKLEKKEIDILIGTHAVIGKDVIFNNLGLVVTDEQHRFGVNQRKSLQEKEAMADVLYMSATPIPRTYALALYGDMDLSMIKTKPSGRKNIITKVYPEKDVRIVLEQVWQELKDNHQVYVVAPLINDEENELNDVNKLKDNFMKAFNNKVKIGIMHGKMKKTDKDQVMQEYKDGKIKILISTTVIEVGVDVKDATVMIIYNAERFGLATLHQLRGRVGRNDVQSYCYLISNEDVPRLKVLEESNDGFYISEKDFEMRGEGDLFGIKQSGDMNFKIGDIRRDSKILMQCKKDSLEYLNNFDNNVLYQEIVRSLEYHN